MSKRKPKPPCTNCGSTDAQTIKKQKSGKKQYLCLNCRKYYSAFENPEDEKKKETITEEFTYEKKSENEAEVSGTHASSLKDQEDILTEFLKSKNVNLDVWHAERFKIGESTVSAKYRDQDIQWTEDGRMIGKAVRKNEWQTVKNYSIKATLVRRKTDHAKKAIEALIAKAPVIIIPDAPIMKARSGVAHEMSIFDAHFGKLAHFAEIGRDSIDLKTVSQDYDHVIDQNLSWASPFKPEKIFFIVGQDLFHTDNNMSKTTRGDHVLDVDSRLAKIFDTVFESVTKAIMKCRKLAPVEVLHVRGNHDEHASYYLCLVLNQFFKNDKHVTFDITDKMTGQRGRKARLWGNLLVGFTHRIVGRQATWANELAQEFPDLWGKSRHREWHFGDKHKKEVTKITPVSTAGGVVLRQLTALSNIDKWHYENLYTDAVPGGESFLWSKDNGVFANFIAWTGQRIIKQV